MEATTTDLRGIAVLPEDAVPPVVHVPRLAFPSLPDRIPAMKSPKDEAREVIEQMPETASLEDIQYHLYVRQKVRTGLVAESEGRVISRAEAERRMSRWLGK
jgi:hypothetical protein